MFLQRGNVSRQPGYNKPAYQATRDGIEAKEAHEERGSTKQIYADSSVLIRCYAKCPSFPNYIPYPPPIPQLGLHTAPSTSPTPSRGR